MNKKIWVVGAVFLAAVSSNAAEKLIFSMDFEELVSGLADSTPGWESIDGKVIVKQTPEGKVLGSDGVKSGERNEVVLFYNDEPFGIKPGSKIAIEFDAYVKSEYGTVLLGIGDAGVNPPLLVGLLSADFFTRAYYNFKEEERSVAADGNALQAPLETWLTIRCELDFESDTGTMEFKPVGSDDDFTPVYFDAAQKKRTFTLGTASPKNTGVVFWSGLYFRFSHVDGMIDNIRIVQF